MGKGEEGKSMHKEVVRMSSRTLWHKKHINTSTEIPRLAFFVSLPRYTLSRRAIAIHFSDVSCIAEPIALYPPKEALSRPFSLVPRGIASQAVLRKVSRYNPLSQV